jgi:3-methylcrotonyl-CoA carboxylase alpha subunit/geranyl-CoA carboxylase alpha subunit
VQVRLDGVAHRALLAGAADGGLSVTLEDQRHRALALRLDANRWQVQVDGTELWLDEVSFEPAVQEGQAAGVTEVRAPFNGRLIGLPVAAGQAVRRGDTLAVIESMKLEHALAAPRDGVVQAIAVECGQQLATSQILMRLETP